MKELVKKFFWVAPLVFAIATPAFAAVSQEGWNVDNLKVTNLPDRPVSEIMLTFIDWAIIIIGLLCIIIFIYGGFLYLTAQGEEGKIETAKKVIIYAVIGVVVSVLGYVVVKTVNDILVGSAGSGGGSAAESAAPTGAPSGAPAGAPAAPAGPSGTTAPMPVSPGMVQ